MFMDGAGNDKGRRLLVTKIPQAASQEMLFEYFSKFGDVREVNLNLMPRPDGGAADILFSEAAMLTAAIRQSPHQLHGTDLHCAPLDLPEGVSVESLLQQERDFEGVSQADAVADLYSVPCGHALLPQQELLPQARSRPDPTARLFVAKVPQALQQEHLRHHFARFGELTDVYLPAVRGGTGHKGICFVSFAHQSGLQAAMLGGPHEIMGYQVVVDVAAPRGEQPPPRSAPPLFRGAGSDALGQAPVAASPCGSDGVLPVVQNSSPAAGAGPVDPNLLLGAANLLGGGGLLGACNLMALGGQGPLGAIGGSYGASGLLDAAAAGGALGAIQQLSASQAGSVRAAPY